MSWLGVSKFLLGFWLAIAILFGTGVGVTRYMLARVAAPPPRPTFANDPSPSATTASTVASPAVEAVASPAASPPPTPAASPTVSPAAPQGRQARVIQPVGLILRQDPGVDAAQIGGVEYNQNITVLEDSQDGEWQRVRLENGTEGWVKAGNTEQLN